MSWRLMQIYWTFFHYRLDEIIFSRSQHRWIRFLPRLNPWQRTLRHQNSGTRLCLALESLGPIFIKLGQNLSTRPDLIPENISQDLARLQDHVQPFPTEQAIQLIEQYFGQSVSALFSSFDPIPPASASIAQVHAATLNTGEHVIIKITRPGIHKHIHRDLKLMLQVANIAERFLPTCRRFRLIQMIHELKKSLDDELDLQLEAANCQQLHRYWQQEKNYYIPKIYWHLSRTHILVQERLEGISPTNLEDLKKHNIDTKKLAHQLIHIFFTQVFRDCFFHADLHPGNLLIKPASPEPVIQAIDFGIIGILSPADQFYLAVNFQAFFDRDYYKVAELHVASGWVPEHIRLDHFAQAIRAVSEPIFALPIHQISFANLLLRLFQVARQFEMNIQPQLILLQKSLLNIEGLGRQLDPNIDLWTAARPVIEYWIKERLSTGQIIRKQIYHLRNYLALQSHCRPPHRASQQPNPVMIPITNYHRRDLKRAVFIAAGWCLTIHQYPQTNILLSITAALMIWLGWGWIKDTES